MHPQSTLSAPSSHVKAGRPLVDLTGQRFGRLTVTQRAESDPKHPRWSVICDCGMVRDADATTLRAGNLSYCSWSCPLRPRVPKPERQPDVERNCPECGSAFVDTTRSKCARFCSRDCTIAFHNRTRTLKPNVSYDCVVCGKHVERWVSHTDHRNTFQFCSRTCKGKVMRGDQHPRWDGGKSTDPEHKRLLKRQDYRRHADRSKERSKRYRQLHPEVGLAKTKRRSALKRGAKVSRLTAREWDAIQATYAYRCAYCGEQPDRLTQDHVIPLSKGGAHVMGNVVPACRSCNSSKHVGPPPRPVQGVLL